ncbi:MAG: hypothetical protein ABJD07_11095 [Gemmatimonadaceae bacterium]
MMQPGMEPGIETSARGIVFISLVFIVFGIVVFFLAISALKSGTNIELLSHDRPIDGYEGMFIFVLAELSGAGGLWAVARRKKRK